MVLNSAPTAAVCQMVLLWKSMALKLQGCTIGENISYRCYLNVGENHSCSCFPTVQGWWFKVCGQQSKPSSISYDPPCTHSPAVWVADRRTNIPPLQCKYVRISVHFSLVWTLLTDLTQITWEILTVDDTVHYFLSHQWIQETVQSVGRNCFLFLYLFCFTILFITCVYT